MNRDTAVNAYRRTKDWAMRAQAQLVKEVIARGACQPIEITLHNWGHVGGEEPYKSIDRYYRYQSNKIWRTAERLESHFAKYF